MSVLPGAAAPAAKTGGPVFTIIDRPIGSPADIMNSALLIAHELRTKLNNRMTAKGSAIGDTRIRSGAVLRFEGLGPDWSGDYRVFSCHEQHRRERLSHELRGQEGVDTVSNELLAGVKSSVGIEDEEQSRVRPKFYGVTVGTVVSPLDPLMLGRLQVRLPFIDSLDLSPWARVATLMAGPFHGSYFIPNVGDEVLVAFEHGDVTAPYIIGSLWNLAAPPPMPSPLPQIRALRTFAGAQIVFQEVPPSIYLQTPTPPEVVPMPPTPTGPHQTVWLTPAGIQILSPTMITLQVQTTTVQVTPGSILLQVGGSSIAVTPAGVFLQGGGASVAMTGGNASIIAPMVRINS